MGFRGNDGNMIEGSKIGMAKDCRPDYEAQASNLKKKLDSTIALNKAMEDFADKNNTYQFADISSFAEMVGGVLIVEREQQSAYNNLLKQIEKAE